MDRHAADHRRIGAAHVGAGSGDVYRVWHGFGLVAACRRIEHPVHPGAQRPPSLRTGRTRLSCQQRDFFYRPSPAYSLAWISRTPARRHGRANSDGAGPGHATHPDGTATPRPPRFEPDIFSTVLAPLANACVIARHRKHQRFADGVATHRSQLRCRLWRGRYRRFGLCLSALLRTAFADRESGRDARAAYGGLVICGGPLERYRPDLPTGISVGFDHIVPGGDRRLGWRRLDRSCIPAEGKFRRRSSTYYRGGATRLRAGHDDGGDLRGILPCILRLAHAGPNGRYRACRPCIIDRALVPCPQGGFY